MNKKIKLILLILGLSMLLFGCGAKVDQTLIIDDNFSGARIFDVHVDNETLGYITGGADALTSVLQSNKPQVLDMTTVQDPDGDGIRYQFFYEFDTIDAYIEKTKSILGTDFTATFEAQSNPDNPFGLNIKFEETNSSKELLQWAIDAVAASGITSESPDSYFAYNAYSAQFKETEVYLYMNDTITFEEVFKLNAKRIDIKNDLDSANFSISVVYDKMDLNGFDLDLIKEFFNERGSVQVTETEDEQIYTYHFSSVSDYQAFLSEQDIGTFELEKSSTSPIRKAAYFNTYVDMSYLLDGYSESREGISFEVKSAGYFDEACEFYSEMNIDERTDDQMNLSTANLYASVNFNYNKSLTALNIESTRTLESSSRYVSEVVIELDPAVVEQFDMDAAVQYFEQLGMAAKYKSGDSPKLILTQEVDLNTSVGNLFNTLSFYETHRPSFLADSKVNLMDLYDFNKLIQSNSY